MTKEEKIKEAWSEYYHENINSDGWFNIFATNINLELCDVIGESCRPKSLKGIENNNMWIKIESEADLPKNSINKRKLNIHYYAYSSKKGKIEYDPTNLFGLHSMYQQGRITHYQPIERPKPPIY